MSWHKSLASWKRNCLSYSGLTWLIISDPKVNVRNEDGVQSLPGGHFYSQRFLDWFHFLTKYLRSDLKGFPCLSEVIIIYYGHIFGQLCSSAWSSVLCPAVTTIQSNPTDAHAAKQGRLHISTLPLQSEKTVVSAGEGKKRTACRQAAGPSTKTLTLNSRRTQRPLRLFICGISHLPHIHVTSCTLSIFHSSCDGTEKRCSSTTAAIQSRWGAKRHAGRIIDRKFINVQSEDSGVKLMNNKLSHWS